MHRNQSVSAHSFAMVPRADIPRSRFNVQTSHKTTFDSGFSPCDIPHFVCDALEFSSDSSDSRVSDFTFGGFRDDED